MRNHLLTAALIAHGCGCSDTSDGSGLATAHQAISVPPLYGLEANGFACSPPWNGGTCRVPDNKAVSTVFRAATCSAWWQARFVEVWYALEPFVDGLDDEWAWNGPDEGGGDYRWQCGDTAWLGTMVTHGATDKHDVTGWGTLVQYTAGTLTVDVAAVESVAGWAEQTDYRRKRLARNLIYYLVAMQFGHGQDNGSPLMAADVATWFTTAHFWSPEMLDTMTCYNEDSGTTDDCL